jgi:hypothetical protein
MAFVNFRSVRGLMVFLPLLKFMMADLATPDEAWNGITPLLQTSAQVIVRIGGTRLGGEELRGGLLESLNSTGRRFRLMESRTTSIRNDQRRIFQTGPDRASVEHDFRFKLA